ncbi:MAG: hypothetical protein OXI63_15635 [Candidatus Poribacteria bacterium]|nr:hypothetical protein [Candidatus Poribacteria bacterium]MYD59762.1 hypothetical protein [Gemmatimonadota bacterium]
MKNLEKPSILVIDDESDELRNKFNLMLGEHAAPPVIHPQDVEESDLNNVDLVLVDYRLKDWSERNNLSTISLQPANGMALAVVLREQVDENKKDKLTAFALHTDHLEDIQGRLPPKTAQHVLARLNNLEWIFSKKDHPNYYSQMFILARAVQRLPSQWSEGSDDSTSMVKQLLAMDEDDESFERCWQDVKDCRVPVEELTVDGHGILFIRWLLHQVLPYPSFLWAEHWVAARFGISIDALREVLEGDSDLAKDLEFMRYSGILEDFLGDRWWRGAIEDYAWNVSEGLTADVQHLRDVLSERAGMKLKSTDVNPAVVCVDKNWQPTDEFLSPMTAITLHPDHWPPFADPAWMDIETVQNDDTLLPLVNPLDQHRIMSDKE